MTIALHLRIAPQTDQRQKIADKLNKLVGSLDFFRWDKDYLRSRSASNVEFHNKALIFLSLFCDSHHEDHHSFTSFGNQSAMMFYIPTSLLTKLESILDNINSVSDINIILN